MGSYIIQGPGDYKYDLEDNSLFLGYRKHATLSQNKHFHKGYEIQLVLSGERYMFSENRTLFMKGGDLMLIPPETLHKSLKNNTGSEIFTLCCRPSASLCGSLGRDTLKFELARGDFDAIKARFERIVREFRDEHPGYTAAIRAAAEDLFVQILRLPGFGSRKTEHSDRSGINRKMMEVAGYINANAGNDLNLSVLAGKFYISPAYLSRCFHRETGFSLVEYINNTRTLKAKTELLTTDDTVSTICERCGFGSVTNFGRIFKSITGVSPRVYRLRGGLVPE